MPETLKKQNIIRFIYISSIVIIFVFFLSISPPSIIEVYNQSHNDIPVGEIYRHMEIGQTFEAAYNYLSGIEVLLATFNRENKGTFIFRLREGFKSEDDWIVYPCDMRDVQDNSFFRFPVFPKKKHTKGKKYYFLLEAPYGEPGNAITIWSSSEDLYKDGEKIINGVPSQGDLVFKTVYELGWSLSFHTLTARLMITLNFLHNLFKNQVSYFVILLMLFLWAFIKFIEKYKIFQRKGGFLLVFGVVSLVVSLWIILLFMKKIEVFNQFHNTNTVGEIYGRKKVGQTFRAQHDHLTAIEVLMGIYNRKNTGELIFHLKGQGEDMTDLYHSRIDMLKIRDNQYHRFKFPEVKNSRGRKYSFYLEAPNARRGNAITIWSNGKEDKYREGTKIIDGEKIEGDLVFKTIYVVKPLKKINLFLGEITQNKPSPLNKKSFYVGIIILFVLTCSLFLTYITRVFVETCAAEGKRDKYKKFKS